MSNPEHEVDADTILSQNEVKITLQRMEHAITKQELIIESKKEDLKFEKKVLADLLENRRDFARDPDLPLFDK